MYSSYIWDLGLEPIRTWFHIQMFWILYAWIRIRISLETKIGFIHTLNRIEDFKYLDNWTIICNPLKMLSYYLYISQCR